MRLLVFIVFLFIAVSFFPPSIGTMWVTRHDGWTFASRAINKLPRGHARSFSRSPGVRKVVQNDDSPLASCPRLLLLPFLLLLLHSPSSLQAVSTSTKQARSSLESVCIAKPVRHEYGVSEFKPYVEPRCGFIERAATGAITFGHDDAADVSRMCRECTVTYRSFTQ